MSSKAHSYRIYRLCRPHRCSAARSSKLATSASTLASSISRLRAVSPHMPMTNNNQPPRSSDRLKSLRARSNIPGGPSSTNPLRRTNARIIPENISTNNINNDIEAAAANNNNNNEPNDANNSAVALIDSASSTNNDSTNNNEQDNETHISNDTNDNDDNTTSGSERSGIYLSPDAYRNLQDTIDALQTQIESYSERWTNALDRIDSLQERNATLQEELHQVCQQPPPAPQAQVPDHSALLQTLINAQLETNRLQLQAQTVNAEARRHNTQYKFPTLKSLTKTDISVWYQKLLTVQQLPKYKDFYDDLASDIIASGAAHPSLNTTLYSEILLHTSAEAETYILSKSHLRGDCVELINDIQQTFNSKWTTVEIQSKQLEWIQMKMTHQETIHEFLHVASSFAMI